MQRWGWHFWLRVKCLFNCWMLCHRRYIQMPLSMNYNNFCVDIITSHIVASSSSHKITTETMEQWTCFCHSLCIQVYKYVYTEQEACVRGLIIRFIKPHIHLFQHVLSSYISIILKCYIWAQAVWPYPQFTSLWTLSNNWSNWQSTILGLQLWLQWNEMNEMKQVKWQKVT